MDLSQNQLTKASPTRAPFYRNKAGNGVRMIRDMKTTMMMTMLMMMPGNGFIPKPIGQLTKASPTRAPLYRNKAGNGVGMIRDMTAGPLPQGDD